MKSQTYYYIRLTPRNLFKNLNIFKPVRVYKNKRTLQVTIHSN